MNDEYVLQEGMSGERLFALRLMKGFNFAPITADAVLELSKEFFLSN